MAASRTDTGQRQIELLRKDGQKFESNLVITSHYTFWNFVPKNLSEQFSKPANVYFLFLSILQCLPEITTTSQMPTILLPLAFMIMMNAAKDAVEDHRRHKSDKIENERATLRVTRRGETPSDALWQEVEVGDYIVVQQNEYVPADIILLTSANENGQAFVETANLDGETNLKTKQAPDAIFNIVNASGHIPDMKAGAQAASTLEANIVCEGPNASLYTFVGALEVMKSKEKVPLDDRHIVLRGCKVKNVQWCLGVVIYTGQESKIMMNSQARIGRKLSHLERDLSKFTGFIFSCQTVLCLVAAIFSAVFESSDSNRVLTYLNLSDEGGNLNMSPTGVLFVRFFNFFILFSNFIPISLLVSVSIVKLVQVYFIYCDRDMIYDGIHCIPRTSDLNEEMGQIEYVFSDKTGTLTKNVMDFRKFCVNGQTYGEGLTEIKRNVMIKRGEQLPPEPKRSFAAPRTPHVDLVDGKLDELMANASGEQYEAVCTCLMHLAINHEVIPDIDQNNVLTYSASSPDESALAYGARHLGYTLRSRDSQGVTIQIPDGRVMKVSIPVTLKFNATRKRSSVIAEIEETNRDGSTTKRIYLYTKGADSVIIARLRPELQRSEETKQTLKVLKDMAEDGLRTLCLAGRELDYQEFESWVKKFETASLATERREEQLDEVSELIEVNLVIHGITGIEDRLQEDVSGTIIAMAKAGIKVWMLTGDKTETAINIGIATGLLDPHPKEDSRLIFSAADFEGSGLDTKFREDDLVESLKRQADIAKQKLATGDMFEGMVIDGKCLETALLNPDSFVAICKVCRTVICCRVSPKQKGAVVRLIKAYEKAITLAVGDGANDCNMIQSADVGVGIRGLEGLQAFNVCDYGISQFRFLSYLLLVHGRWCYRRVAILVNYTFYKNIVVVMPQYYLGIVSGFSGQKLYNDFMYQMYNVIHSMFPVLVFGILDQDVSKKVSLQHPELYSLGPQRAYLNMKVSGAWLLSGVWHSVCVFWIPYLAMSNGNITNSDGKANDIWMVGTVVYLLVVIVVNVEILLETCFVTCLTYFAIGLSFFFWFLEHGCLSGFIGGMMAPELHGSTQRLLGSPMLYIVIICTTIGAIMVDLHMKGFMRALFPSTLHKVHAKILLEKQS